MIFSNGRKYTLLFQEEESVGETGEEAEEENRRREAGRRRRKEGRKLIMEVKVSQDKAQKRCPITD